MVQESWNSPHDATDETAEATRPIRRLLLIIWWLFAVLFGFGALVVALVKKYVPEFLMHGLLELSAAFLSVAVISMILKRPQVRPRGRRVHRERAPEPVAAAEPTAPDPLGVEHVFEKWLKEIPQDAIRNEFIGASEVEVAGVSVYNSLSMHDPLFGERLYERLHAGKHTRFLLLRKDGVEIKRRDKEGREPEPPDYISIHKRNALSHDAVERAHQRNGDGELSDVLRAFDFSPSVNFLRFDGKAYIIFVTDRGGFSPAVKVRSDSLLYQHYKAMFTSMWEKHNPRQTPPPPKLTISADSTPGTTIDE